VLSSSDLNCTLPRNQNYSRIYRMGLAEGVNERSRERRGAGQVRHPVLTICRMYLAITLLLPFFLCTVLPLPSTTSNAIEFLLFATHSLQRHTSRLSFSPTTYLGSTSTTASPSRCWSSNRLFSPDKRTAGSHHLTRPHRADLLAYARITWVRFTQLDTDYAKTLSSVAPRM
jgi:hypothetical protein